MLMFVSCVQQKYGSCFHIHFVSLCLFIGKLSLLILRDTNNQEAGHRTGGSLTITDVAGLRLSEGSLLGLGEGPSSSRVMD